MPVPYWIILLFYWKILMASHYILILMVLVRFPNPLASQSQAGTLSRWYHQVVTTFEVRVLESAGGKWSPIKIVVTTF